MLGPVHHGLAAVTAFLVVKEMALKPAVVAGQVRAEFPCLCSEVFLLSQPTGRGSQGGLCQVRPFRGEQIWVLPPHKAWHFKGIFELLV